jgi:hypothetical protein
MCDSPCVLGDDYFAVHTCNANVKFGAACEVAKYDHARLKKNILRNMGGRTRLWDGIVAVHENMKKYPSKCTISLHGRETTYSGL